MKRILLILLSCLLIISICSCNNDKENADESAETTVLDTIEGGDGSEDDAHNEDIVPSGSEFDLIANASKILFFGEREIKGEDYISCNYPGSGFESKIKCDGGEITLSAKANGRCSFVIYIDGELLTTADGRSDFSTIGTRPITIEDISAGEHTIKIIRASGYGADVKLYSLVFSGEMLSADSVNKERKFIEFIGDGVNSTVGETNFSENVSLVYPYLVASETDIDYSITAYNDCGLVSTKTKLADIYGEQGRGNFERKADIAVINVGSLDILTTGTTAVSVDRFKAEYQTLVEKVKLVNGEDCKIVFACTIGNEEFRKAVSEIYKSLGGEKKGYYLIMLSVSRTVSPTQADHKAYAEEIAEFLNDVKDYEILPISGEPIGTGDSIAMDSEKWEVI